MEDQKTVPVEDIQDGAPVAEAVAIESAPTVEVAVVEPAVTPVAAPAVTPVVEVAPVQCAKCGTSIPQGMQFCPACGKKVGTPAKAAVNKKGLFIGIGAAVLAVVIGLIVFFTLTKEIPAADLVVSETKVELKEEESITISCTVYPQDATDKTVIWTSSDTNVATVNELGCITAVKKGECIITAQCGEATKEITVTVKTKIDFQALFDGLDTDIQYGWKVGSDGTFLSADSNVYDLDDYSNSAIWASIKEMNKTLGLPASLTEDMGNTTWSMGRQTQKFSEIGIEVTWTYHPDKGMEVTYKLLVE